MKTSLIIALLLITSLLLTSCNSDAPSSSSETPPKSVYQAFPNKPVKEVIEAPTHQKEVAELIKKSKAITNYQYTFHSSIRNEFGNLQEQTPYAAYHKDNQIKKVYSPLIKLNREFYYDSVYLFEGRAVAVCSSSAVLCEENFNLPVNISYEQEQLKMTPKDLILTIPFEAKKVREEIFENRNLDVLEYKENSKRVRLSVDTYSGLPLKKIIYANDDEGTILEEYIFYHLALGDVKTKDITLP